MINADVDSGLSVMFANEKRHCIFVLTDLHDIT